jgi:hypothetical protein
VTGLNFSSPEQAPPQSPEKWKHGTAGFYCDKKTNRAHENNGTTGSDTFFLNNTQLVNLMYI